MKYLLAGIGIVAVLVGIFAFGGKKQGGGDDYVRIHIVANSNCQFDQNVKYVVKDAVTAYLAQQLDGVQDAHQAAEIVAQNMQNVALVANAALAAEGASYCAHASLADENLPTRVYENFVLEGGTYNTLQIKLGQGLGDNWWCVVFPAVCFFDSKNCENVEYISKILEILNCV